MPVVFTSDTHLGHKNIVSKYRPQFDSVEEHDSLIFDEMGKLSKRDILVIVGDFLFDCKNYQDYMDIINKMSCRIQVVMGNHDSLRLYKEPKLEVQLPLYTYKKLWVSHCPIHPEEVRFREGCIHGHLHDDKRILLPNKELDMRYFNVNVDSHRHKFVPLEQIKEYFNIKG